MILPIDYEGRIYVLENEQGKIIGSGTRKTCEVLLKLITTRLATPKQRVEPPESVPRATITSVISI